MKSALKDVTQCHETGDVGSGDVCPTGSYCPAGKEAAIECEAGHNCFIRI